MVYFITHTEPANAQSGNLSRFYIREFNEHTGKGRSLTFELPFDIIVPRFELPRSQATDLRKVLEAEHPEIRFEQRRYSLSKDVIWAYLEDKKQRHQLPDRFLGSKTNPTQMLRWFFPPFLIVDVHDGELILPSLEQIIDQKGLAFIDPSVVYKEKRCALDIETTGWLFPDDEESITAVVLNYGNGPKQIVTVFGAAGVERFRDYAVTYVEDTDAIKKFVSQSIAEQDPLLMYFFNGSFDKKKLRDLGNSKFTPGTDFSYPVFKSVQGLKNMVTKGRWDVELYGYAFLHRNLYKNNKLGTHAQKTKTLDHVTLEFKTKEALAGNRNVALELLRYVADDGDITFNFGESQLPLIIPKSYYAKREPASICTTTGVNIMREVWRRKFFFSHHTFLDRYDYGRPEEITFDPEEKKDEILGLAPNFCIKTEKGKRICYKKPHGFYDELHLFYPMIFIRAAWPMVRGTTENLLFGTTPDEHLNYAQVLHSYITQALERYFMIAEQKDENGKFPKKVKVKRLIKKGSQIKEQVRIVNFGVLNDEFIKLFSAYLGDPERIIDIYRIDKNLRTLVPEMVRALNEAGVVTFSKKFIYVKNAEPLVRQAEKAGYGFVYGSGPTICAGERIASLVENDIIFQGFKLTGGTLSDFEKGVIEGALWARLTNEVSGRVIDDLMEEHWARMATVPRRDLIFRHIEQRASKKKGFEGISFDAGALKIRGIVPENEFLESRVEPDFSWYRNNFERRFGDVLAVMRQT